MRIGSTVQSRDCPQHKKSLAVRYTVRGKSPPDFTVWGTSFKQELKKMKFKTIFITLICLTLMFALSNGAFAQASGKWVLLQTSGLDTLTGVAADSIINTVSLLRTAGGAFSGGRVTPRVLLIIDEVADISNGEGVTARQGMGVLGTPNTFETFADAAGIDTLFASPALVDLFTVINTLTNPGSHFRYTQKAYASAADTDSLTHRRTIYGQY